MSSNYDKIAARYSQSNSEDRYRQKTQACCEIMGEYY